MWRYSYEWKDLDDLLQFFDLNTENGRDAWTDWQTLAAYFEGIGVLVRKGLLDLDLVVDLFSGRIIAVWEKFSNNLDVEEARKRRNDPKMHDDFEYLYHEMKQRQPQATTST